MGITSRDKSIFQVGLMILSVKTARQRQGSSGPMDFLYEEIRFTKRYSPGNNYTFHTTNQFYQFGNYTLTQRRRSSKTFASEFGTSEK